MLVLATLAGCRSMRAEWAWAQDLETTVVLGLGFARGIPVRSTVLDVVGRVDMDGVSEVLLAAAGCTCAGTPRRVVPRAARSPES